MFSGNYVNIETVLNSLKNYPYVEGLNKRDAAHKLVTLLGLIGSTVPLKRQYKNIQIVQHKGELPSNIVFIQGVNYKGNSCDNQGIPMKYASDIYLSVLNNDAIREDCGKNIETEEELALITKEVGDVGEIIAPLYTVMDVKGLYIENSYTINAMSIDTSHKDGWVEMVYDGIMVDSQGFPMIPDEAAFKEAYRYFLLKSYMEPLFLRGLIPAQIYNEVEKKYYAYAGSAEGLFLVPSPDQMESIANTLLRIIPAQHQYRDGWESANRPKY